MTDLGKILTGLVERTEEGRLLWHRGAHSEQFIASVDTISMVIEEYEEDWGRRRYRLNIYNESGDLADSLDLRDLNGEQLKQLERLFVLARRSANNVDSTLEKLAKALEL